MTYAATSPATGEPLPNQVPVAVASAEPNPAHAGDVVSFDGTGSYDAETPKDQLTYQWSFPDGTTKAGYQVTKQFDQAGVYDVVLTVSDGSASDSETVVLEVDDTAPVAEATATPSTSRVGQAVAFDASGSRDAETARDQLGYSWDLDSDGDEDATGMAVSRAYEAAGTYTARLTVTDPQGARGVDTVEVTVTNSAPTAAATATPNPASAGQEVTFDASGSSDAETTDDALVYEWDFGDGGGADAYGKVVRHAYPAAGAQVVTLTVRDPQGLSSSKKVLLTVTPDSGPTAVAKATPTRVNLYDDVTFDGSDSSDAETPQDQLRYSWDFGDGGSTVDATTAVATFDGYESPGTKTARLTVTDANDNSATDTVEVQVGNERPVADAKASPDPAKVANPVTFDGTGSSDAETPREQLRYEWDFGDGSPRATTAKAEHVYAATGTYTVTLKVKDAVGSVGTDTITLKVNNSAPDATFTATPNPVNATQNLHLDATGTTDGESDRSRLTFTWDFGDGGDTVDATGPVVTHAYPAPGPHQVTLTVNDPHGGADTSTTLVGVMGNTAPTANATATPGSAKVSQPVTFDGSRSTDEEDDADAEPLGYLWTFPDGTTSDQAVVSKAFTSAGKKDVTLKVTDSGGQTATRTVSVEVTNTAPVAAASATGQLLVNRTITFDGSRSTDDETPGQLTHGWEFGDGTTATGARAGKRYSAPGLYSPRLTVTDPQGLSDTMTLQVWVAQDVWCQGRNVARTGSWRVVRSSQATRGSYCDNLGTRRGADTMRLRAAGPRLAVTYAKSAKGGIGKVYVDGEYKGRVDFRSRSRHPRLGYTRTFTGLGSGAHDVKLVMVRGAGYVDDFLVWGRLLS
jgi:PKD repeat protein